MADFREAISVFDEDGKKVVLIDPARSRASFVRERVSTHIDHDSIVIGATPQPLQPPPGGIGGPGAKPQALLVIGSKDVAGTLRVMDENGVAFTTDSKEGTIQSRLKLQMIDEKGVEALMFDPKSANVRIGGVNGNGGDLQILNGNRVVLHLDGDLRILDDAGAVVIHLDREGRDIKVKGNLKILDDTGGLVIHLDRDARDIKLKGADCAEVFAANDASVLEPGSLCVIGASGALEPCGKAYDTRVAGVVAGAGDLHPGIVLGQGTVPEQSVALSITGRVWCKVDASFGPIVPGDLVTTSTTPGHGMRADDRSRLTGAIAGKALAALPAGCEMIPILVGLQ